MGWYPTSYGSNTEMYLDENKRKWCFCKVPWTDHRDWHRSHTWAPDQGVDLTRPDPRRGGQNYFNVQTKNLHYPSWPPGNHNATRWKFSMQKCIKSQIYTPFLTLGEPVWDLRKKNFAAKRLKIRVFENLFWPHPLLPPGGHTVPTPHGNTCFLASNVHKCFFPWNSWTSHPLGSEQAN